jgi:hypothetical protein
VSAAQPARSKADDHIDDETLWEKLRSVFR